MACTVPLLFCTVRVVGPHSHPKLQLVSPLLLDQPGTVPACLRRLDGLLPFQVLTQCCEALRDLTAAAGWAKKAHGIRLAAQGEYHDDTMRALERWRLLAAEAGIPEVDRYN